MKNKNLGLAVGAIFFALIGTIHLIRTFIPFEVVISGYSIAHWVSPIAFAVSWALAGWFIYLQRQSNPSP